MNSVTSNCLFKTNNNNNNKNNNNKNNNNNNNNNNNIKEQRKILPCALIKPSNTNPASSVHKRLPAIMDTSAGKRCFKNTDYSRSIYQMTADKNVQG